MLTIVFQPGFPKSIKLDFSFHKSFLKLLFSIKTLLSKLAHFKDLGSGLLWFHNAFVLVSNYSYNV